MIGIISRSLATHALLNDVPLVKGFMRTTLVTAQPTDPVPLASELMIRRHVGSVLVTAEAKGHGIDAKAAASSAPVLLGIVTRADRRR